MNEPEEQRERDRIALESTNRHFEKFPLEINERNAMAYHPKKPKKPVKRPKK